MRERFGQRFSQQGCLPQIASTFSVQCNCNMLLVLCASSEVAGASQRVCEGVSTFAGLLPVLDSTRRMCRWVFARCLPCRRLI